MMMHAIHNSISITQYVMKRIKTHSCLWTTVARFLVGKGPTKVRMSTEGIDLYTALAFIDRETDKWLNGKQGK
jgi:hypothetical protein